MFQIFDINFHKGCLEALLQYIYWFCSWHLPQISPFIFPSWSSYACVFVCESAVLHSKISCAFSTLVVFRLDFSDIHSGLGCCNTRQVKVHKISRSAPYIVSQFTSVLHVTQKNKICLTFTQDRCQDAMNLFFDFSTMPACKITRGIQMHCLIFSFLIFIESIIHAPSYWAWMISNKLAKLRRHASRIHFAKIHFGQLHFLKNTLWLQKAFSSKTTVAQWCQGQWKFKSIILQKNTKDKYTLGR